MKKIFYKKTLSKNQIQNSSKSNILFYKIFEEQIINKIQCYFLLTSFTVTIFGIYFNNIKHFNDLKNKDLIIYLNIIMKLWDYKILKNSYPNFYFFVFLILKIFPLIILTLLLLYLKNKLTSYLISYFKKLYLFILIIYLWIILGILCNAILNDLFYNNSYKLYNKIIDYCFFIIVLILTLIFITYNKNNFFDKKNYLNYFNDYNIFLQYFFLLINSIIYSLDYNFYPKYILVVVLILDLIFGYFYIIMFTNIITFKYFYCHMFILVFYSIFLGIKLMIFINLFININIIFWVFDLLFIIILQFIVFKKLINNSIYKFLFQKNISQLYSFKRFYFSIEKLYNFNKNNKNRLYLYGILENHNNRCLNISCYCKKLYLFDNKKKDFFLNSTKLGLKIKYYIKHVLEVVISLKKNQNNHNILFFYLEFLIKKFNLWIPSKFLLRTINRNKLSFLKKIKYDFIHYSINNYINSKKNYIFKGISFLEVFSMETKLDLLKKNMEFIIEKNIIFWENFINLNYIEYDDLNNQLNEIIKIKKSSKLIFKELKCFKNISKIFNIYYIFFNKEFLNKKKIILEEEILEFFNFDENFSLKNELVFHSNALEKLLFSKRTFSVHLDTYKQSIGNIIQISNGVYDLLDYIPKNCLNKNINFLLPDYIANFHNILLKNAIIQGHTNRYNGNEIISFAKNSVGNLIKVKILVKYIIYNNNCDLIGLIKESKDNVNIKDHLVLNEEGELIGVTKRFSFLNKYIDLKPNIFIWIPNLILQIEFLKLKYFKNCDSLINNLNKCYTNTNDLIKILDLYWEVNDKDEIHDKNNYNWLNKVGYFIIPKNLPKYLKDYKTSFKKIKKNIKSYKNKHFTKITTFYGININDKISTRCLNSNDFSDLEFIINENYLQILIDTIKKLKMFGIDNLYKINYNITSSSIKNYEKIYIINIISYTKKNYYNINLGDNNEFSLSDIGLEYNNSSLSSSINLNNSKSIRINEIFNNIENQRKLIHIFNKGFNIFHKDITYMPLKKYYKEFNIRLIIIIFFLIIILIGLGEFIVFNIFFENSIIRFENVNRNLFVFDAYLISSYSGILTLLKIDWFKYSNNFLNNYPKYILNKNNETRFINQNFLDIDKLYNNIFIKQKLNENDLYFFPNKKNNYLNVNWSIIDYIENYKGDYNFYRFDFNNFKKNLFIYNDYFNIIFFDYFNNKFWSSKNFYNDDYKNTNIALFISLGFTFIIYFFLKLYLYIVINKSWNNGWNSLLCFNFIEFNSLINIKNYYAKLSNYLLDLKNIEINKIKIRKSALKPKTNLNKYTLKKQINYSKFWKSFRNSFFFKLFIFLFLIFILSFFSIAISFLLNYYYVHLREINRFIISDMINMNNLILSLKQLYLRYNNFNQFNNMYNSNWKSLENILKININLFNYEKYINNIYFQPNLCKNNLNIKEEIKICEQLYNNNLDKGIQNIKEYFTQKLKTLILMKYERLENFTRDEISQFDVFILIYNKIFVNIFKELNLKELYINNIIFYINLSLNLLGFCIYIIIWIYILKNILIKLSDLYNNLKQIYKHFIPSVVLNNKILLTEWQKNNFLKIN